jgi:hypothetical protein
MHAAQINAMIQLLYALDQIIENARGCLRAGHGLAVGCIVCQLRGRREQLCGRAGEVPCRTRIA